MKPDTKAIRKVNSKANFRFPLDLFVPLDLDSMQKNKIKRIILDPMQLLRSRLITKEGVKLVYFKV